MSQKEECEAAVERLMKATGVENKPGERAFYIADGLVRLDSVLRELTIEQGVPTQALADFVQSWSASTDAANEMARPAVAPPSA